jgi:hypothetical protein
MKKLIAVINGESKIEYDRSQVLPDNQLSYLDKMDQQMDSGIPQGQGNIFAPQIEQKAQFVANQLINAIQQDDEQLIAATMAYLAIRLPDLQQVVAEEKDGETNIKLIHDKPYVEAQAVQFVSPDKLDS